VILIFDAITTDQDETLKTASTGTIQRIETIAERIYSCADATSAKVMIFGTFLANITFELGTIWVNISYVNSRFDTR